jgi:hypothetical protein
MTTWGNVVLFRSSLSILLLGASTPAALPPMLLLWAPALPTSEPCILLPSGSRVILGDRSPNTRISGVLSYSTPEFCVLVALDTGVSMPKELEGVLPPSCSPGSSCSLDLFSTLVLDCSVLLSIHSPLISHSASRSSSSLISRIPAMSQAIGTS